MHPNDPFRYIEKSDADSQVQRAPRQLGDGNAYPKWHSNREGNRITAYRPLVEFPLIPNTTEPWTNGPPGPVRAIYNETNRHIYDVVYHDDTKPRPLNFSQANLRR